MPVQGPRIGDHAVVVRAVLDRVPIGPADDRPLGCVRGIADPGGVLEAVKETDRRRQRRNDQRKYTQDDHQVPHSFPPSLVGRAVTTDPLVGRARTSRDVPIRLK